MSRRWRIAALATGSAALVAGVAAAAVAAPTLPAGVIRLHPATAGAGTTVVLNADPVALGFPNKAPKVVTLGLERGFRLDPGAVARRCRAAAAKKASCPARSRIGTGSATGKYAIGPAGGNFDATITAFLGKPAHKHALPQIILEISEPQLGTVSSSGQIVRSRHGRLGYRLHFNFSSLPVPPGLTLSLNSLKLKVGASRRGRSLVANPRTCNGQYLVRLAIDYVSGSPVVRDAEPACRAA
jgi:hypothetical protein